MKIYGAGLAGLLAAQQFQNAQVFETRQKSDINHKALLRFRSSAVGDSLGIEFQKVLVHKGIFIDGKYCLPTPRLCNWYSKKVICNYMNRSIWDLSPAERYIAPEDFIHQLIDRCESRIQWESGIKNLQGDGEIIISTMPMNRIIDFINPKFKLMAFPMQFQYQYIKVLRWRIPNCNVHQTVYFPSPEYELYRASITGDLLIAEYMNWMPDTDKMGEVWGAFGIKETECIPVDVTTQHYGKIAPIDDIWRKQFIHMLSTKYNIYSLGRFATWRNILLDDVLKDISVIKKLMTMSDYDCSTLTL